jgi:STE24 endopeptidase
MVLYEMHPLIDKHLQKKAALYEKKKTRLGIKVLVIATAYLSLFYILGFSRHVAESASRIPIPVAIAVYMISLVPLGLISFPINYLKDYVLEKRFGLNSQGIGAWLADRIKGLLLGIVLGYPLLLALFFLFAHTPHSWWVFGAIGLSAYQLLIGTLFPVLILPIFFKQEPIEDKTLVQRIHALFAKAGIRIRGSYSFNLSTRTKRENAALAGFWKTRRVLIADNLLNNRTIDEILVVLAHEIGHHKKRHLLLLSLLGFATSFVAFYATHVVMSLFPGFPENLETALATFPVFSLLLAAVSSGPIRLLTNACSRSMETQADEVSLELTHNRDSFVSLMAGLANNNLAIAYPKRLKKFVSYSHPPIGERIEFAEIYHTNAR